MGKTVFLKNLSIPALVVTVILSTGAANAQVETKGAGGAGKDSKLDSTSPPVEKQEASQSTAEPGSESEKIPSAQPAKGEKNPQPIGEDSLSRAKQLYNAGKYKDALTMLDGLKQDAGTHYYKGLCLEAQGQFKPAAAEFHWILLYSKDEKLRSYAQANLKSVSRAYAQRKPKGVGNITSELKPFYKEQPIKCYKCGVPYMKSTSRCACPTTHW